MRETFKSRLQNSGSCLLGFLFGLGFSGTVVLSDAFNAKPQAPQTVPSIISLPVNTPRAAPTQEHILKTARAVAPASFDIPAQGRAATALSPETIEVLQNLQPTARGKSAAPALPAGEAQAARQTTAPKAANDSGQAVVALSQVIQPTAGSIYRLHLASVSDRANINDAMAQLASLYPALLKDVPVAAQQGPAKSASGGFTRIYAGTYDRKTLADAACDAFKEVGQYCAVMSVSQ